MTEHKHIESKIQYYVDKSFWLETSGDDLSPRPMLEESKTVDIAIMGGGFTGLWTAYYLLLQNPSLNIAILEKDIIGFGASGRNGGWCYPQFPISPAVSIEKYGIEVAREIQIEMFNTVNEIGRVAKEEAIDIDYKNGGGLQLALGEEGFPTLESEMQVYKNLGLDSHFNILNEFDTNERVKVQGAKRSLLTKNAAVLNPGKLVRKLAKVLEKRGVKIYEQTEVVDFEKGSINNPSKLITKEGSIVSAKTASLLAGEAYMSQMAKFRRKVLPMYSLITLTEPLTPEQWSTIGWGGRELVGSTRYSFNYLQRTVDGRILFGGRGQPYRYGSRIKDSFDRHEQTNDNLKRLVTQWFPSITGIKFTHSWGGPVGIVRDFTPNLLFDKETRIASAWGFVGQGVSTTNLAGRLLTDLIMEKKSKLTELPIVQHKSRKWEMEPFRWIGARYVQVSLERIDKKAETTNIPPGGNTIAERLNRH
ncbi:NAD(P)/FAD-dependent oxidoreductase [Virgibacillus sp. W0181]|uniref:NAD(P)/FAD-dependent oxidoreductase n=1 Tax=Virgibacillus sp. W0181 TaxID=3391581 RepID=UPI003F4778F4